MYINLLKEQFKITELCMMQMKQVKHKKEKYSNKNNKKEFSNKKEKRYQNHLRKIKNLLLKKHQKQLYMVMFKKNKLNRKKK